jgi:hypothetical protein
MNFIKQFERFYVCSLEPLNYKCKRFNTIDEVNKHTLITKNNVLIPIHGYVPKIQDAYILKRKIDSLQNVSIE